MGSSLTRRLLSALEDDVGKNVMFAVLFFDHVRGRLACKKWPVRFGGSRTWVAMQALRGQPVFFTGTITHYISGTFWVMPNKTKIHLVILVPKTTLGQIWC